MCLPCNQPIRFAFALNSSFPSPEPPVGNSCPGIAPFPYDNGNRCCNVGYEDYDLSLDPTCDGGRLNFDSKCCGGNRERTCKVAGQCTMSGGEGEKVFFFFILRRRFDLLIC